MDQSPHLPSRVVFGFFPPSKQKRCPQLLLLNFLGTVQEIIPISSRWLPETQSLSSSSPIPAPASENMCLSILPNFYLQEAFLTINPSPIVAISIIKYRGTQCAPLVLGLRTQDISRATEAKAQVWPPSGGSTGQTSCAISEKPCCPQKKEIS